MTDQPKSPDEAIQTFVRAKIHPLLPKNGLLSPSARAMLAQLRQSANREPGTVPSIWAVTSDGLPDWPGVNRDHLEVAVHMALTQFAVHQQSKSTPMQGKRGFGSAVRALTAATAPGADVYETPVYRRFTALMSTTTSAGIRAHLTGLISQLRSNDISLDYGRLASDLYWMQFPATAGTVRRRWGRDFHSAAFTTTTDNDTTEGNN